MVTGIAKGRSAGGVDTPSQTSSVVAQLDRLISKAELCSIVPYTPQHILRLEKRGLFPRRIQVGANRVAWLSSEIEAWLAARIAERDGTIAPGERNEDVRK